MGQWSGPVQYFLGFLSRTTTCHIMILFRIAFLKALFHKYVNSVFLLSLFNFFFSTNFSNYQNIQRVKILTKAVCLPRNPRVHCCLHGFQTINPKRYRTNMDVFANVLKKGLLYFVKTYCGKKIVAVSNITNQVRIHKMNEQV